MTAPEDRPLVAEQAPPPATPVPEPTGIPYVTIVLAAANVIVFGLCVAAGTDPIQPDPDKIFELGGNFGPMTLGNQPWRLFTSMFLHYGLLHLAMNMIGLVDGGRHVERMYGRAAFAAIYVFSGLVGSLASAMAGKAVSAGASGAIFGIFGAYGAYLLLHRDNLDKEKVKKESRGLLIFLAYNIVFGLQAKNIDMLAHLGGLGAGFVAGLILSSTRVRLTRALLVGLVGSGVVIAASYVVPKPQALVLLGSTKARFEQFSKLEERALDRYNGLVGKAITDEEMARVIDEEVLPAWREGKTILASLEGLPESLESNLRIYADTRERAFVMMVAALRKSDAEAIKQAMETMREADAYIEKLKP